MLPKFLIKYALILLYNIYNIIYKSSSGDADVERCCTGNITKWYSRDTFSCNGLQPESVVIDSKSMLKPGLRKRDVVQDVQDVQAYECSITAWSLRFEF